MGFQGFQAFVNKLTNHCNKLRDVCKKEEYGLKTLFCETAASLCLVSKTFTDAEVMASF